jgi:membrane protein YdbS with pleckstrin-like domain
MENMIINHWAVLAAAIFNMLLGAIWYSPVMFYNGWKAENQLTDEQLKNANQAKMYGISFFLAYLMSYNMAFFLGDANTDWQWGLTAGFLTGFGWAAAIFTCIALFEQRSWKYICINSGYIIIYFSVIGLILGTWR